MYKRKLLWIKFKSKIAKIKHINMAWLIFGITIFLLLNIILPSLFQRAPYYSLLSERLNLPYELNLCGKVISEEEEEDYSFYTIYIGGYKERVEKDGSFEVLFLSEAKEDIVVMLLDDKNKICYYTKVAFQTEKKNLYIRLRGASDEVSRNYYFGDKQPKLSGNS